MSKILEAIDSLAKNVYFKHWQNPAIKRFIETGDEALLLSIPPMQNAGAWELNRAMPPIDDWTPEAGRVLQLSHAKGLTSLLDSWLGGFAKYGNADWGNFGRALDFLHKAGLTDSDIRKLLMDCDTWDMKLQKPTPAGELVLHATDAEIQDGMKQSSSGSYELPALLAHAQPDRLDAMIAKGLTFKYPSMTYGIIARANPARFAKKAFEVCQKLASDSERISLAILF